LSPWEGTSIPPEKRWHEWWAWYPVMIPGDGYRALCFFEIVLRRRVNGRWEYQLAD